VASGLWAGACPARVMRQVADLDAIEQLHKDEMIGQYDTAEIDNKQNVKPHAVKRMNRPHIHVIPERLEAGRYLARSCTRRLSKSSLTRQGLSRLASQPSKRRSTKHSARVRRP